MRPRLRAHVRVRRHLVGDRAVVLLHAEVGRPPLGIGEREWRVVRAMDGTRDVEGVGLAAGVARDAVEVFVGQLEALGLLGDPSAAEPAASPARDLPVVPLPGYGFACTGRGACCGMADAILFTPLEAARARGAAPAVLDAGHDADRAFVPERGLDEAILTVAMVDGACAYLDAAGRCRVYAVRPHGCRTFPRWHVDVGVAIRVAPRLACACELEPADAPITEAVRGRDLPPALWVDRVPEAVRLGPATVPAAEAMAFTDAIAWEGDVLEPVVELADRLGAPPVDRAALRARIDASVAANAWRAPDDRLRRALSWMRVAVDRDAPTERPEDERLAARALAFVGGLALGGDVGAALRALEERLWLARRFPDEAGAEGFARHPIALVNAVARATPLW